LVFFLQIPANIYTAEIIRNKLTRLHILAHLAHETATILASTGCYLPEKVVVNEELRQFPPQALSMIPEKTGVRARRVADPKDCTSDIAARAAQKCLAKYHFDPLQIQGIILATSSPDRMQPATATRLQHLIGAKNAFALDINSVCSGSTFGIALSDGLIRSGQCEYILLVAAEIYSRILNPKDYATFPFFGDGAGAVLLRKGTRSEGGVLHSLLQTDGASHDMICVPAGGTQMPFGQITNPRSAFFRMRGPDIFSFAVGEIPKMIRKIVADVNLSLDDIACFICHQANINIIHKIAAQLNVPADRFFINLEKYGNTAGASVLIALDEAWEQKIIKKGDRIITVAFGGGLSWGANLIQI
jgi:3-oxoacyl-[acyl-carrier-protein] synthase-3